MGFSRLRNGVVLHRPLQATRPGGGVDSKGGTGQASGAYLVKAFSNTSRSTVAMEVALSLMA